MGEHDGLAVMLQTLKERSGLSYAVLARRLHTSPSTLHRYCNGETVPQEFGTIERFAKLCKATPDELTELHRRWVIAGETRTSREQPAPPTPEPVPEPTPTTPVEESVPATPKRWPGRAVIALAFAATLAVVALVGFLIRDNAHQPTVLKGDGLAFPVASSSSDTTLATGPPPVAITVTPFTLCARDILVDRPPEQTPPTVDLQDTSAWVNALNGVVTRHQDLSVTVQGTDNRTVVLDALHVRTVSSDEPPSTGNVYVLGDGCGGGVDTSIFDINLDMPHPEPSSPKKHNLPLKVSKGDPVQLEIAAQVATHDVTWYLELDWSSGGKHGTLRIDDHGKPFRTTGVRGQPLYYFNYDSREWEMDDS